MTRVKSVTTRRLFTPKLLGIVVLLVILPFLTFAVLNENFDLIGLARGSNRRPRIYHNCFENAYIGKNYNCQISAADPDGDPLSLDFKYNSFVPGLQIVICSPSGNAKTCPISGTPTQTGRFSVTVTASDYKGGIARKTISISVRRPGRRL